MTTEKGEKIQIYSFGDTYLHNKSRELGGIPVGFSDYFCFGSQGGGVVYLFKGSDTRILMHEMGHVLFLNHAPNLLSGTDKQPAEYKPNEHNEEEACIMSYDPNENGLCGLCILKLSGWDDTKINKDGSISS